MIALLESLKTHHPFAFLDNASLNSIEKSAQIVYYPENTTLIHTQHLPQTIFYIIKGSVDVKNEDELFDVYHSYDTFGGIEIIKNKLSEYNYIVSEELICYEIPAEIFLDLCKENKAFEAYFFSSIAERMDRIKEKREEGNLADMMLARVETDILHHATLIEPSTPIVEALFQMEADKAVAIIVKNPDGYGIVTDADFRKYILHKEKDNLSEISQIQTYPMHSIKKGELLSNVLLLMMEHSIKHLPVFDEKENVLGVLELIDLLSLFSNQTHLISVQIERAGDLDAVIFAAKRVEVMVGNLHTKGVKSHYIAKLVAEIKKKMYRKIFEMVFPKIWQDKCTLVLLGSEGREEQILRTDQDNALIFEDGFTPENVDVITQKFISVLDKIGFPRCEGNVMIINPKWCKSLSAYKKDIHQWIDHPSYEGFIDMAIFFDSMAVAGEVTLQETLQTYLMEQVANHKQILPHFARSIEAFESPLGLFARFSSGGEGHEHEIDIKKGALFALIHGVRALALEHGITATNTTQRIQALNDIGYLDKEDTEDMLGALEVINTLRLHAQIKKLKKGKKMDNYIYIPNLSKLERDVLKEALKVVEKFKKRLHYHFHLSMVG